MATTYTFADISLDEYRGIAEQKKGGGWRYVQSFCTNADDGIMFTVTFEKNGLMENFQMHGLTKDVNVPSITDLYFSAFVFENEAHDLFGLNISDIAIDFEGHFYDLAMREPMTVISPAQKAAKEKAAKIAKAKAAKAAKDAKAAAMGQDASEPKGSQDAKANGASSSDRDSQQSGEGE